MAAKLHSNGLRIMQTYAQIDIMALVPYRLMDLSLNGFFIQLRLSLHYTGPKWHQPSYMTAYSR